MYILIGIVFVICLIALVVTLYIGSVDNTNYNTTKSINNQLWMYLVLIPIITIILVVAIVYF
ncbi:BshB3 potential contributor to bacillithiol synthesis [Bacillus sp. FJAT-45037]|uniref:BshB3 potential contributor to bacillithiol synthesis n=1 Tax=Bacillus sp. FJAT-45037 TaxID=2011007 RepID=UPI000C25118F|nr:BshB3 potential contributor to bacillithiol synthesis [Bacillus sp. FJAT-45037]